MSPSYIRGALDTLVKAGEVSPAYAAGVCSVLEKEAGWWPWQWLEDSPHQNYLDELDAFLERNPGRWDAKNQKLKIEGPEAVDLLNRSRHWHDNFWSRTGTWAGNRLRKMMRWWPSVPDSHTPEYYDRELRDARNRELRDYILREHNRPGRLLDPAVAAAIQDQHVGDAKDVVAYAKATMPEYLRKAKGIDDDYPETFKSPHGSVAYRGGAYRPKHIYPQDAPKVKKLDEPYGRGLPEIYGTNRSMFYERPYGE